MAGYDVMSSQPSRIPGPTSPEFKAWAQATKLPYGSPEQLAILQAAGLTIGNVRTPEQKEEYFRKRDSGIGGAIRKVGGVVSKVAQVGVPLAVGGGLLGALGGAAGAAGASGGAASTAAGGGLAGMATTGLKKILPDKLGGAVDWIGNNADKLLNVAGTAEGIYSGIRGEQLRKRALSQATVPMPKRQDLSSLFNNPGDVYQQSSLKKVG